jgi:hypothetical protein
MALPALLFPHPFQVLPFQGIREVGFLSEDVRDGLDRVLPGPEFADGLNLPIQKRMGRDIRRAFPVLILNVIIGVLHGPKIGVSGGVDKGAEMSRFQVQPSIPERAHDNV